MKKGTEHKNSSPIVQSNDRTAGEFVSSNTVLLFIGRTGPGNLSVSGRKDPNKPQLTEYILMC